MRTRFRGCLAAVLLIAAASQLAATPAQASAGHRCEGADSGPGQASYAKLGRSTLCLVNRERRQRGLRALRANKRLGLAARRHAGDMVRHSYFAHNSRSGARPGSRIARSGYLRGAPTWLVGENLGLARSTPRSLLRSWMKSPSHRANVLNRRFRDLGVAVTAAVGGGGRHGFNATYVHEFGVRR